MSLLARFRAWVGVGNAGLASPADIAHRNTDLQACDAAAVLDRPRGWEEHLKIGRRPATRVEGGLWPKTSIHLHGLTATAASLRLLIPDLNKIQKFKSCCGAACSHASKVPDKAGDSRMWLLSSKVAISGRDFTTPRRARLRSAHAPLTGHGVVVGLLRIHTSIRRPIFSSVPAECSCCAMSQTLHSALPAQDGQHSSRGARIRRAVSDSARSRGARPCECGGRRVKALAFGAPPQAANSSPNGSTSARRRSAGAASQPNSQSSALGDIEAAWCRVSLAN